MKDNKGVIVLREKSELETQTDYVNYIINEVIPEANSKLSSKEIEIAKLKENIATLEKEKADLKTEMVQKDNEKYESLVSRSEVDLKSVAKDLKRLFENLNNNSGKDMSSIESKVDEIVNKYDRLEQKLIDKQEEELRTIKKLIKDVNNNVNNAKKDIIENINTNNNELAPKLDSIQSTIGDVKFTAPIVTTLSELETPKVEAQVEEKEDYKLPEDIQEEMINNAEKVEDKKEWLDDEEEQTEEVVSQETQMPEDIQNELVENTETKEEEFVNPFDQILNPVDETPTFEAEASQEVVNEVAPEVSAPEVTEAPVQEQSTEQVFDPFNSMINPEVPAVEAAIPVIGAAEVIAPAANVLESIAPSVEVNQESTAEENVFDESAPAEELTEAPVENVIEESAPEQVVAQEEAPQEVVASASETQEVPSDVVPASSVEEEVAFEAPVQETAEEVVPEVPAQEVAETPVQEESAPAEEVAQEVTPVEEQPKTTIVNFGTRATRMMLNSYSDRSYKDEFIANPTQTVNYSDEMFDRFDENLVPELAASHTR